MESYWLNPEFLQVHEYALLLNLTNDTNTLSTPYFEILASLDKISN